MSHGGSTSSVPKATLNRSGAPLSCQFDNTAMQGRLERRQRQSTYLVCQPAANQSKMPDFLLLVMAEFYGTTAARYYDPYVIHISTKFQPFLCLIGTLRSNRTYQHVK
jgi:hypothetical protein